MGAIAIAPHDHEVETLSTNSLDKIEDNIYRFFDFEEYRKHMIVSNKYNDVFELALNLINYFKVHRTKVRAKMIVFTKRLTEFEHTLWHEDPKDEIQIRILNQRTGLTRDLIISRR